MDERDDTTAGCLYWFLIWLNCLRGATGFSGAEAMPDEEVKLDLGSAGAFGAGVGLYTGGALKKSVW